MARSSRPDRSRQITTTALTESHRFQPSVPTQDLSCGSAASLQHQGTISVVNPPAHRLQDQETCNHSVEACVHNDVTACCTYLQSAYIQYKARSLLSVCRDKKVLFSTRRQAGAFDYRFNHESATGNNFPMLLLVGRRFFLVSDCSTLSGGSLRGCC